MVITVEERTPVSSVVKAVLDEASSEAPIRMTLLLSTGTLIVGTVENHSGCITVSKAAVAFDGTHARDVKDKLYVEGASVVAAYKV
jgi:hypothetical protein